MGEASSAEARHVGGSEESLEGKGVVIKTGKGGEEEGQGKGRGGNVSPEGRGRTGEERGSKEVRRGAVPHSPTG